MQSLQEQIALHQAEIEAFNPTNAAELEAYRIKFLGTKGIVKAIFGEMKNVPAEQKKEAGQLFNAFKQLAEGKYATFKHLQSESRNPKSIIEDISLPGPALPLGTRHPLRVMENRIVHIFEKLGFAEATGPEIEDDWHNFTSLNMPADHPARDMQDTFYVSQNPDWVLRTHTSSVQARMLGRREAAGSRDLPRPCIS